jgi:proteic killer suppression protein
MIRSFIEGNINNATNALHKTSKTKAKMVGASCITYAVPNKCQHTEALSKGHPVRRFVNMAKVARRKLRPLEIAARLDDLRVPPGNQLEALKGDRAGQYSIRINDQWRVCFRWTDAGVEDVEIVDYR